LSRVRLTKKHENSPHPTLSTSFDRLRMQGRGKMRDGKIIVCRFLGLISGLRKVFAVYLSLI